MSMKRHLGYSKMTLSTGRNAKMALASIFAPSFEYLHIDSHMSRYVDIEGCKGSTLDDIEILQNSIRCLMMLFLVTYCVIDT